MKNLIRIGVVAVAMLLPAMSGANVLHGKTLKKNDGNPPVSSKSLFPDPVTLNCPIDGVDNVAQLIAIAFVEFAETGNPAFAAVANAAIFMLASGTQFSDPTITQITRLYLQNALGNLCDTQP